MVWNSRGILHDASSSRDMHCFWVNTILQLWKTEVHTIDFAWANDWHIEIVSVFKESEYT